MAFLATVYTSPRPQSVKFRVLNGTASPWGAAASPEGRWWSYRLRRDGMVPSSMTKEQPMSPLRARMIEDMKLAGLAATTQEIPPGGQVSGEALQSVAGAAGRGRGPAISAGCS